VRSALATVEKASLRAVVRGRVQGVFFRAFVRQRAYQLNLSGYVRNARDGTVEVVAEGGRTALEKLLAHLKEGPPAARVDRVDEEWGEAAGRFDGFEVRY
jgi:acylphosphatase